MHIDKDIVIIGGGVAGLWLLNRLRQTGYAAILLERTALGDGQSIASQGMIHGGMKYALGGALTGAAQAIADMPAHWRRCLDGNGDVDLRGTRLLSDTYYMWPRNSLRSRLNAFLGSKSVRGKVDTAAPDAYPAFFKGHIDGPLYQLRDLVLDVPSLLATLAAPHREHIYRIDWPGAQLQHDANGSITGLQLAEGPLLRAQRFISTAGAGTAELLGLLAPPAITMQKRPLQMAVVRHQHPHPVYVHCVSDQLSATPELTITTHSCQDGSSAWYLGGELAEAGAHQDRDTLLAAARAKLQALFPWCDLHTARWHSFHIDRAEAAQPGGKRPDQDSVLSAGNLLYCWPTKLTLAPNLANTVLTELRRHGTAPGQADDIPLTGLPTPAVATPPWEF